INQAMKGCRSVLHLAALIGIPYSYLSPHAYLDTNIKGTYNVLEAARLLDYERVLVTSTSETYGTAQYVPIDEKHPPVGQSPYAATKVAADQLALSYHMSFGLPVTIARPFNTYGPRQSSRAIIPTIISQVLAGHRTLKLGNLDPTRDLTYVRDTAGGIVEVACCDAFLGSATNIGTNSEISVRDLVGQILALLREDVEIITDPERVRPEDSEVERLVCDNTRLQKHTDWRPEHDLRSGLEKTIGFVREHLDDYKPSIYTV
ncbi:MAG: NAD-dependent epimerase/dehydratase family protein, partial [Gemmatimonadetes bacterium]|nr:NAD-dependent epimerase/dehydratase family protein [Gemmatimonadota bacterium]